jgi:hypothetical protein
MAKEIKGNLEVLGTVYAHNNNIVTSVNTVSPDINGNINLDFDSLTLGTAGSTLIYDINNNVVSDRDVKFARIIDTDKELADSKSIIESFSTVFNEWYRFSHLSTDVYPAIPSELNGWQYNSSTDTISSTVNSSSYIGFVSPDTYNDYIFNVKVAAPGNGDDDLIGVVLAYLKIKGREYTISAARTANNSQTSPGQPNVVNFGWSLVYNLAQSDQYIIQDGTLTTPLTVGVWSDFPNGCLINSERNGNIISTRTTQLGGNQSNFITPLSVDLESDERFKKFINPASIGYSASSQPAATFNTLLFSKGNNVIYDSRNGDVWLYNVTTGVWTLSPDLDMYDELKSGYIYSNSNSGRMFYINNDRTTTTLVGKVIGNGVNQVPSNSFFNFVRTTSTNGYQKFPSGLIIQWGTVSSNSSGRCTLTLPIVYPNTILGGIAESASGSSWSATQTHICSYNQVQSTNTVAVADVRNITSTSVSVINSAPVRIITWGY